MTDTPCEAPRMMITETMMDAIAIGVWMCTAGLAMILLGLRKDLGESPETKRLERLHTILK